MPSPGTDKLYQTLLRTELVSAEDLEAVWTSLPAAGNHTSGSGSNRAVVVADSAARLKLITDRLLERGLLTVFQRDKLKSDPNFRFAVHSYLLLDQIETSPQATVFLARHRWLGQKVALKLFQKTRSPVPAGRATWGLTKLRHPNLVPILDLGLIDDQRYAVTEYVGGSDLEDLVVKDKRLTWQDALIYLRQVARALEYGHQQGVIHQDLRPSHILVDDLRHAKLLGLGLGPALDLQQTNQRNQDNPHQMLPAVRYAAPEQFRAQAVIDAKTDVYSLGCVLYFVLVGAPPFPSSSYARVMIDHQRAPVPSLQQAQIGAPKELDELYRRMVSKQPENRPQSMAEVATEFDRLLTKAGVPLPDPLEPSGSARGAGGAIASGPVSTRSLWRLFVIGGLLGSVLGGWLGWRLCQANLVDPLQSRFENEAAARRTLEHALTEAALQLHELPPDPPAQPQRGFRRGK